MRTHPTQAATATLAADAIALVEQLGDALERSRAATAEAVSLCDRLADTLQQLEDTPAFSAWSLVEPALEDVRDVLPGGNTIGEPLDSFPLLADVVDLAARHSDLHP